MQRTIAEENYGVTRQALTKTMIEDFRVPVPPLHEQRRIVAKIGSLSEWRKGVCDELVTSSRGIVRYSMLSVTEISQLFDDLAKAASKKAEPIISNVALMNTGSTDRSLDVHRTCPAIPA